MNADLEPLRELFRHTLDALDEMLGLLQAEAEALGIRDAAALERIAQQKQELVPILERLTAAQRDCLGVAPVQAIEDGIGDFLARTGADPATAGPLRADWQAILAAARACQRQNEHNGAYIGLLRRHVETSLDILHGPSQAEATYGPDGAKRRNGYARRSYSV